MPEGQTTVEGQSVEGQRAGSGFEAQAPGPDPAKGPQGQVVADNDGDEFQGQDGDLNEVHPSNGIYPDTQVRPGGRTTGSDMLPTSGIRRAGSMRMS